MELAIKIVPTQLAALCVSVILVIHWTVMAGLAMVS